MLHGGRSLTALLSNHVAVHMLAQPLATADMINLDAATAVHTSRNRTQHLKRLVL
jgi:hypothetical protein